MNSVAVRLYVVVGIVLAAYGIGRLVKAAADPPEVTLPEWSFHDLPMQLGKWNGEDTEMDPKIAAATGAYNIANRIYRDRVGRAISLHSAMFEDPAEGLLHSPLNCYRANGWVKIDETQDDIKVSEDFSIPVILVTWKKENQQIIVAYWYQLGRYVMHHRLDLGSAHWNLRGQAQWPVLMKIMIQAPVIATEDTQEVLLDFGAEVAKWINSPEHREYLDQW